MRSSFVKKTFIITKSKGQKHGLRNGFTVTAGAVFCHFRFSFLDGRIDDFILIYRRPASILIFLVFSFQKGATSFAFDNLNIAIFVPLEHGVRQVLRHDGEFQVIRSWTSSQGNASLRFTFQVSKEVAFFGSSKSILFITIVSTEFHRVSVSIRKCNGYTWDTIKRANLVQRKAWNRFGVGFDDKEKSYNQSCRKHGVVL